MKLQVCFLFSLYSATLICIIITSIIIQDYRDTLSYKEQNCYIQNTTQLYIVDIIGNSHAYFHTIDDIILYYPPIEHWRLTFTTTREINEWFNSQMNKNNITCWLKNEKEGITDHYKWIIGAYLMLVLAILLFFVVLLINCMFFENCAKKTMLYIKSKLF